MLVDWTLQNPGTYPISYYAVKFVTNEGWIAGFGVQMRQ